MRRYVTIGGIVVATVLVGSAAAYAGPEVLASRAVSVVNADQPEPTGSATPTSSAAPSSAPSAAAPPVAAAPCPPAAVAPPTAAAPTTAPSTAPAPVPAAPPVAVTPTTASVPATEPALSTLPAPPTPAGGAFQVAPAKAVPDVPASGGSTEGAPAAESSSHDGPGDGGPGHDKQNGHDSGGHDSSSHDSGGHDPGKQNPSAQTPGEQDGSDMNGATTPPATPAPASPAPASPAPASPAPAAPAPADCTPPTGTPAAPDTSAATKYGWGAPSRVDNFDTKLDSSWSVYDGPGHNGAGRRTPDAITVENGIMTMTGDEQGNSGGMAWQPGQRYGRWEARVRSHAGDPDYHAVLLLWPDAENWPVGGEIDFMEISDPTRQNTQMFLHYGQDNQQVQGSVDIDATQWHDWAVEWAPTGVTAYVDGKVWWSTKDTSILPPGPMHMTIQLDNFGGTNMKKTSMDVDWVKEYKLGPAAAAAQTAEGALDTVGSAAGGLVEGAADAVGDVMGQATRPLTEGAPDPIPAVTGLVPNAVRG